jgi:Druantia protein DruA
MVATSEQIVTTDAQESVFELNPTLSRSSKLRFLRFCRSVEEGLRSGDLSRAAVLDQLREELPGDYDLLKTDQVKLQFVSRVILDLVYQGWELEVNGSGVKIRSLQPRDAPHATKEQVRAGHLLGRNAQLRERSVVEFIKGMERRRLYAKGWHSIFSLMRDGRELADKIEAVNGIENEQEREAALSSIISPYIQFVDSDAVCEHTGLRLGDIWRYFRYTWVNEYKSVPGRSLMILIRDAAGPNHPVIGIAALGSSVAQHTVRDEWIGWQAKPFVEQLIENPTAKKAQWLLHSLDSLFEGIYIDDLAQRPKLCTKADLQNPSDKVIDKLLSEADRAIKKHRKNNQKDKHKGQKVDLNSREYWLREAHTYLYRSKRCRQLAQLMGIRKLFLEHGLTTGTQRELQEALKSAKVRAAIAQLVRMVKAEHVGVDMMDITVCGAIAPYNHILGGKLVCMLLCSPELNQHYDKRYGNQVSIIASSMKGSPVVRKPNLVLLCTTSLYGVGSSQYNRVKIPLEEVGGQAGEAVLYKHLEHSKGYGTYQFSRDTVDCGTVLISRRKGGRRVNSIFGEGVNPLMRKIREALGMVGLSSDGMLLHGNRRVTYGISFARNFREILLGVAKRPSYLIPQSAPHRRTELIADYWRRRWLSSRTRRPEVITQLSQHTLAYPITHGAVVTLPTDDEEAFPLFTQWEE